MSTPQKFREFITRKEVITDLENIYGEASLQTAAMYKQAFKYQVLKKLLTISEAMPWINALDELMESIANPKLEGKSIVEYVFDIAGCVTAESCGEVLSKLIEIHESGSISDIEIHESGFISDIEFEDIKEKLVALIHKCSK